jgi:P-type Ca2+ transporter type 2C
MQVYYWQETEESVLQKLETTREGLNKKEVRFRYLKFGPNTFEEIKKRSLLALFFSNFKSPLILILFGTALISFALGKQNNGAVIFMVIMINATIGFFEELKAEKTIDSLRKIATLAVTVIRGGQHEKIPSSEIVPGDIVVLEEGVKIPADGRLIEAHSLQVDESVLTGESAYIDKSAQKSNAKNAEEANNLVYMGTSVTSGRGELLVTETGKNTEFGKITTLVADEFHSTTPLQKKINKFTKQLGLLIVSVCIAIFFIGIYIGNGTLLMFETTVSIAVSAIPSGLPIAITIALVLGMKRMAKKKAVIRKMNAVETLGTTTVIASDKTGTLTHNKLMVTDVFTSEHFKLTGEGYGLKGRFLKNGLIAEPDEQLRFLLTAATVANDGDVKREKNRTEVFGDPTDCALLVAAEKAKIDKEEIESIYRRISEIPFSSERKYMATLNSKKGENYIFVKGAYEEVLSKSSCLFSGRNITQSAQESIKNQAKKMTNEGLRVIGVAYKKVGSAEKVHEKDINDLHFIGLLGMKDTYRLGARKAIQICHQAGIKIVMITGDHLDTAKTIGRDLGILKTEEQAVEAGELERKSKKEVERIIANATVFARIRPDTKYKIIEILKEKGEIVAMTGDGVNDVPALTKADIGIAMGVAGTDAAKEAADMVLVDDNFSTIVLAVEEGRTIFDNIRKALFYLLSTSFGEVLTMMVGLIAGLPLILNPLQILWVNMVTDTAATIPLGMEPTEKNHLKVPPRNPKESVLSPRILRKTFLVGTVIAAVSVYLFIKYLSYDETYARTAAFTSLVVVQWFNALNARSENTSIFQMKFFSNPSILIGILVAMLAQAVAMSVPIVRELLGITVLSLYTWLEVIALSALVIIVIEAEKVITIALAKKKNKTPLFSGAIKEPIR